MRMRAIPEHLRGVFTTRCYTTRRLPYLYLLYYAQKQKSHYKPQPPKLVLKNTPNFVQTKTSIAMLVAEMQERISGMHPSPLFIISQLPKLCVKISILRHRRMWVHSFSTRLTSGTFAEDKVLIFLILRKNAKIVQL